MTDESRKFTLMTANDTELILQAQRGNMEAFEELVQRYDKRVLSIAAGYVNSADDAKDIYQEVFLRVYRGLSKFQMRSEFSTWLFRITTNVCLTYRARKRRQASSSLDQQSNDEDGHPQKFTDTLADAPADADYAERTEISNRIDRAIQKLSARQRMVFTLRHYEGYKLKEIASMLSCSDGAVKRYLFEATVRVRKELADLAI